MSTSLIPLPTLDERALLVDVTPADVDELEIPRAADTTYLTHGLFRYAGKLPPPLVAHLLASHTSEGDLVVDPMCGGGTTAIEAVSSGRISANFDINPVSLLVTEALSRPADVEQLVTFGSRVLDEAQPETAEGDLAPYFSPDTYGLLRTGLRLARTPLEKTLVLSIARRASFANTKKINTVVDPNKTPTAARQLFQDAATRFATSFDDFNSVATGRSAVHRAKAYALPLDSGSAQFSLLHPPYLTNTAFSEAMHLQLLLLQQDPLKIRKSELAFRGSYFSVTNGLRKYLVGWSRILREAFRVLASGGYVGVVIGDGRIDKVRIPVATITEEFAADVGFEVVRRAIHKLNNQTGWTLSRRMLTQHVLILRKP